MCEKLTTVLITEGSNTWMNDHSLVQLPSKIYWALNLYLSIAWVPDPQFRNFTCSLLQQHFQNWTHHPPPPTTKTAPPPVSLTLRQWLWHPPSHSSQKLGSPPRLFLLSPFTSHLSLFPQSVGSNLLSRLVVSRWNSPLLIFFLLPWLS